MATQRSLLQRRPGLLAAGLVGCLLLAWWIGLRYTPTDPTHPPALSQDGGGPAPLVLAPAGQSSGRETGRTPTTEATGAINPQRLTTEAPQMRYRGSVEMDPALLRGREAFVLACGIAAPLQADLRFELDTGPSSCMMRVVLVGRDGKAQYGAFHPVKPKGGANEDGVEVSEVRLKGPTKPGGDDWSVLVQVERNIVEHHVKSCEETYAEVFASVGECIQTTAGQHIDDLAWLEEMAPMVAAMSHSSSAAPR